MKRALPFFLVLAAAVTRAQVINPPQWSSSTSFLAGGLVRGSDGNYYRALHNSTGSNPVTDNHTNWELYYVRANTTLTVASSGARFSSLARAWAMVQSATVAGNCDVDSPCSFVLSRYDQHWIWRLYWRKRFRGWRQQ